MREVWGKGKSTYAKYAFQAFHSQLSDLFSMSWNVPRYASHAVPKGGYAVPKQEPPP
jgi:hypothetical protein